MFHLNLCNKEILVCNITNIGDFSRMSKLCCAWRTSSVVTAPDWKKCFKAYARIFVYVNAVMPVTCVDNISMNLVIKEIRLASNKSV